MKKILFSLIMPMLLCMASAQAQQQQLWSTIARGTSLPSNVPRSGYLFFRTSDSTFFISSGVTWVAYANAVASGGTITGVTANAGLFGGGTIGTVSLDVNVKHVGAGNMLITSDSLLVGNEAIREAQMLWAQQNADSIYSAVPVKMKQITFKFSFLDTTLVGDSLMIANEPFAWTADSINAATNTGTATIFFDHRAHTTPRTRGTNIETGGIVADAYERSAAFDDATIPANAPVFARITATSGSVKQVWVTIYGKKD